MSNKVINTRIKQKRDTDSNWQSKNPILLNGEIILVDMSDGELRAKIGDGTQRYSQLPFYDQILRDLIGLINIKVDNIHDLVGSSTVSDQVEEAITPISTALSTHTHPVDSTLSSTSTNPVQNKVLFGVIQALIDGLGDETVSTQISSAVAKIKLTVTEDGVLVLST